MDVATRAPLIKVLHVSFDDRRLGRYGMDEVEHDFGAPSQTTGIAGGRTHVVVDPACAANHALRIAYPAGAFGSEKSGAQWVTPLPPGASEGVLSYRVRVGAGFDPVGGGKLPGLAGGTVPAGGHVPTGDDGWSGRFMWHEGAALEVYLYHVAQLTEYGDGYFLQAKTEPARLVPEVWHQVTQYVALNHLEAADGVLRVWFDGELVLDRRDIRFRTAANVQIDRLFVSTFFGGDDPSWASRQDEAILFDDITVSLVLPASSP